jgi:DNA-binding HxlR family transcriptional regulator
MTREPSRPDLALCSRFHRAIELIGRRWTGAIVFVLLRARCRYATLRYAIPDITDRMLSERLQELEQEGIVARTVVPETPVRVEYALTRKGRALAAAIDAMAAWAERWEKEAPPKPAARKRPRVTRASALPPPPASRASAPRAARSRGRA